MSTISLITPASNETSAGQGTAPNGGQPSTSFADLLDGAGNEKERTHKIMPAHRAYSFSELGMFGLHNLELSGGSQTTATAVSAPTKLAAVMPASARPSASSASAMAPAANAKPLVYVPFIDGDANAETVQAAASRPVSGPANPPGTPLLSTHMLPRTIDLLPPPHGAAPPPTQGNTAKPAAAEAKPDAVSVTVSGPDEALQIAVRGDAEAPSEVVKLRRLIETTVAHFEMDIAELHINGASVEDAFSLGGGMNGGSAR